MCHFLASALLILWFDRGGFIFRHAKKSLRLTWSNTSIRLKLGRGGEGVPSITKKQNSVWDCRLMSCGKPLTLLHGMAWAARSAYPVQSSDRPTPRHELLRYSTSQPQPRSTHLFTHVSPICRSAKQTPPQICCSWFALCNFLLPPCHNTKCYPLLSIVLDVTVIWISSNLN
jgi:hypothetical protein